MPYIPDFQVDETYYGLSPETYPVVRIGWLDAEHPFPKGTVSAEFRSRLLHSLLSVAKPTRGSQQCMFCDNPPFSMPVEVNGKEIRMGTAEVVVAGQDGVIYSAPNLIYHYVDQHGYLPPERFVAALSNPGALPAGIESSLRKL